jgi:hypothetical protein
MDGHHKLGKTNRQGRIQPAFAPAAYVPIISPMSDPVNMETVRAELMRAMNDAGLKPTTLSMKVSKTNRTLVKNIMETNVGVGVATLSKLAEALGVSFYQLVGAVPPADTIREARINAIEDALRALRILLDKAGLDQTSRDLILMALPTIAQVAQSAREAGHDVTSAVSALALHEAGKWSGPTRPQ